MKLMKIYCVYRLFDPKTKLCKWVGMTSTPADRYNQHCHPYRDGSPKYEWTRSLKEEGLLPIMEIFFSTTSKTDARVKEMETLNSEKASGSQLFNTIESIDHVPIDRRIIKDQNGKVYASVSDAFKETGCPRKGIRMTISGTQEFTKGYKFFQSSALELAEYRTREKQ